MFTQKFSTLISVSFLTYILYILTTFIVSSPKELFRKVIFLKRMCHTVFSKLGAVDSYIYDLEKLQVKDGVTVIVVALPTRNSRCFSSSVKNSSHIAKTMNLTTRACLFFCALIFQ